MSTTNPIFVEAYKQIRNGQLKAARQKLREAIKTNPHSERAWLLMSMAVTEATQQQECLRRVLSLNPQHAEAQQRLAKLQPAVEIQPPTTLIETPTPPAENVTEPETASTEDTSQLESEGQNGMAEAEPVLGEAPALTAEVTVEATPHPEPPIEPSQLEAWTAEPEGLPEWLIAQSLFDETVPDVEPMIETELEDEEAEKEFEPEVEAAETISAEPVADEIATSTEETPPPAPAEETAPEATPAPRAKRRRARRLHTDYLVAHQTQAEEELPAWLTDETEVVTRSTPSQPPNPPPATVAPSPPAAPPAASFEPAPIRIQPVRPTAVEREPARPYYGGGYSQGDTPIWALPLVLLLLSIAVIGILAFLIYLVL